MSEPSKEPVRMKVNGKDALVVFLSSQGVVVDAEHAATAEVKWDDGTVGTFFVEEKK